MTNSPKKFAIKSNQTKSTKIASLLQRNTGATITELAKATGWQRHSVRGFMSGTLKKKLGLEIKSTKEGNKDRRHLMEAGLQ